MPVIFGGKSYAEQILALSPLAYWPMNETGGTTVNELVNGWDGSYTGATLAQMAAPGGGLAPFFDGVNDLASLETAALQAAISGSEGTLSIWAKVYEAAVWGDGAYREMLHVKVNNSNRAYFLKMSTANQIEFLYNGNTPTTKRIDRYDFSSTAWFHAVMSWSVSGDVMRAYINSVEVTPAQTGIAAFVGAPVVDAGYDGLTASGWWKGYLAHAAVWDRALSPSEVAVIFKGGS